MRQDHYSKTLRQNLKSIRQESGLTATDVAKILGVSQAKISYIENGKGILSARDVAILSQRLSVPVSKFYEGLDKTEDGTGYSDLANQLAHFGAKFLAKSSSIQIAPTSFEEVITKAISFTEDDRLHKAFCTALIAQASTQEINFDRIFAVIGNNPFLLRKFAEETKACLQILDLLNQKEKSFPARAKRQLEQLQTLAREIANNRIHSLEISSAEIKELAATIEEELHAKK